MKIIPAIMPQKHKDLVSYVERVSDFVDWVQIDVMDKKYTQSISWPYSKTSKFFDEILNGEEGLPNWEKMNYELDLMVGNPYVEAPRWVAAGVSRIVLHWGSLKGGDAKSLIKDLKDSGIEVGIAKVPHENILEIEEFLSNENHMIDFVQFMGIDRVGFQGEPFVDDVINDVAKFHAKYPDMPISIDGGINPETAFEFAKAGASRLVSGSYIFENQNGVRDAIAELQEASNV